MLLGLYRVGDCVMHLCPICNRRTINVLDDDDDDDDERQNQMKCSKRFRGMVKLGCKLYQYRFYIAGTSSA